MDKQTEFSTTSQQDGGVMHEVGGGYNRCVVMSYVGQQVCLERGVVIGESVIIVHSLAMKGVLLLTGPPLLLFLVLTPLLFFCPWRWRP